MELVLAQQIVSEFFPEGKVIQIEENNKGLINQTFVIWIEEETIKKYILQSVNTDVFTHHNLTLDNIIKIKKSISESSFPYQFPTPIDNKYINKENKVWRLIPYVENSVCFEKNIDANLSYEAAKCLGNFYYSLHEFDTQNLHQTIPDFHNVSKRYNQFIGAISTAKQERIAESVLLIENIQKEKETLVKFDELNKNLPKRVCHFDTKISNFLFDINTNKVKALIDFDTNARHCFSDIGDMIRAYSNTLGEESSDFENVKADREIINLIISGFLKGTERILERRKIVSSVGRRLLH